MAVAASIRSPLRAPLLVTAIFAVSRVLFFVAGIRLDIRAVTGRVDYWQLLDLQQLQHNLVQSIWYLHSQPPAFNVFTGLVLQLPKSLIDPVLVSGSLALGLGLSLTSYYLCLELHIPEWLSMVIAILVVLDPATVLYENWYFYSFPTAVLMTFCALSLARYSRTSLWGWGLSFFISLAVIVLLNSTFQWIWLVAAAAIGFALFCHRWKSMLLLSSIPLLVVSVWYVKNAVIFRTDTTSSWLGMNLTKTTLSRASYQQLQTLLNEKKVSPIAEKTSFQPLSTYEGEYSPRVGTGVVVLDQRTKSDGIVNFNNINYIGISNSYLRADLAYIKTYPATYFHTFGQATELFLRPSDQYFELSDNAKYISGYIGLYDTLIDWQPQRANYASAAIPQGHTSVISELSFAVPSWEQVSYSALLTYAIVLVAIPFVIWRRRLATSVTAALAFIWISTAYVLVGTDIVEFGENMRFRYDLGPLPLIAAVAVIVAILPGSTIASRSVNSKSRNGDHASSIIQTLGSK